VAKCSLLLAHRQQNSRACIAYSGSWMPFSRCTSTTYGKVIFTGICRSSVDIPEQRQSITKGYSHCGNALLVAFSAMRGNACCRDISTDC